MEGTFKGSANGARLSRAALFNGSTIPVTTRFSDGSGMPTIPARDGCAKRLTTRKAWTGVCSSGLRRPSRRTGRPCCWNFCTISTRLAGPLGSATLILHGDADRILPADATSRRQAKMIKNVQFVELKGGPHGVLWTHAEQVNAELVKFLG